MTLPEAFAKTTKELLDVEFEAFVQALDSPSPTSIRSNDKINYQPSDEKVPWCDSGYYLAERPLFTADPLLHAGVYYVQEASSMFLYQAIKQHFPTARNVLDLCAAPGGKSTLLSQTLPESSLLVSNEIFRSRAYILAENLTKWGNPNVVVTNNDSKDFAALPAFFDAIVVDAPCSGEGMFRKDEGAINEWSEGNVRLCVERQREILSNIWNSLKTDGILVYSTCTYNRKENEDNIHWICNELGADILRMNIDENHGITVTDGGYRFYPHKTKGEGFFLSVLRKTTSAQAPSSKNKKSENKGTKFVIKNEFSNIPLLQPERWTIVQEENILSAYDKDKMNDILLLRKYLRCMQAGILLGEMKGSDFIPSAAVALSKMLDKQNVNTVDVSYEEAILFLRKEALVFNEEAKGYLLVTYKGQPLGWVKNMGNRSNNLYPQEWRIRMKINL